MRKIFLTAALVAGFAATGALLPSSAGAMTISTPAAVQDAVAGKGLAEEVRYVCRRVWTGWGWRQSCHWTPSYSYRRHYRNNYRNSYRNNYRHNHRNSYRNSYRYY